MMTSFVEVVVVAVVFVGGREHKHVGCLTTVVIALFGSIFSIRMVIMTDFGALTTRGVISFVMRDAVASAAVV